MDRSLDLKRKRIILDLYDLMDATRDVGTQRELFDVINTLENMTINW